MKREIKFRAWDKRTNEMRKVWVLDYRAGKDFIMVQMFHRNPIVDSWGNTKEHIILMQFTGLKDKNGKDIYEGDVVDYSLNEQIGNAKVEWNKRGYFELVFPSGNRNFIPEPNIHDIYGFQIIGNIYQNPKLMK